MEGRVIKKDRIRTYDLPNYDVEWVTIFEQKSNSYWTVDLGYMHKGKIYKLELKRAGIFINESVIKGSVMKVSKIEELQNFDNIRIEPLTDSNTEAEMYILPFDMEVTQ